ncbi:MAG: PAS domain S-box protein, partial [Bacteroidales bacterium]|nr:PAS domain S-box protein [Bacteroidales bacterium]
MNTNFEKQIISDELEKYKVENALLHEKLKSLESIIEDAATAIIIGNNKGFIIDGNKKIQELTQYSREELCKKKLSQILIKDHVPESFSRKNPKEPSDEFASEQILLLKNEKKIFVSVRTKLLSDGRYQLIINDINKRKKAELALIESEKKYRLLTENIHDVVWTASKNLKIKYISPSIYKVTDYDDEVYYVKRLHEIMTPISYQLLRETLRKQSELKKTGTLSTSENQVSIEIKLIHRRQKNIWVEVIATSIRNHLGESIGFQGVMRNIDDKKRAQEILEKNKQRYNFAVRSAGAGVWELDASLTRINIDENLLNILGYEKNEIKPLLNNWINITIKSDRRYLIDVLQDILDGEKLSMSYECRRIHKSGEIIWFRDYVEAITDENGKVVELIGTSKNISLEKTNEEKKYRYYAGLQILIDSAFNFLKLTDVSKICNYAGKILLQNVPDSIIIFSNIDHDKKESKPRQIYGVNEANLKDLLKKMPFVPHERSIVLPDKEFSLLEKKTLLEYEGGFPAFINKVFNNEEAKLINENLNLNKFY